MLHAHRKSFEAYKELAGDENDDAALDHTGLSIEGRDLVLDLLEGKRLFCELVRGTLAARQRFFIGLGRTTSFSTMPLVPRTEADSKVSIDWSRYCPKKKLF